MRNFQNRIAARGPLKMDWKLVKWHSARIVSHRAQPLGDTQPDTAYRQVVVRLESTQQLTMSQSGSAAEWAPNASKSSNPKGLRWVPEEARSSKGSKVGNQTVGFVDNGKPKKVVEYLVLQRRVINGKEEDWKVWGFAQESTPERLEEDAAYWRKTLDSQAAEAYAS